MTMMELEQAVSMMDPLVQSTAEAVHWNSDILNALVTRVNTLEAWTQVAQPAIENLTSVEGKVDKINGWIDETSPRIRELDGFGNDVKSALQKLESVAAEADQKLRVEIGQLTGIIDKYVAGLNERILAVEAGEPRATTAPGLGLSDIHQKITTMEDSSVAQAMQLNNVEGMIVQHTGMIAQHTDAIRAALFER